MVVVSAVSLSSLFAIADEGAAFTSTFSDFSFDSSTLISPPGALASTESFRDSSPALPFFSLLFVASPSSFGFIEDQHLEQQSPVALLP